MYTKENLDNQETFQAFLLLASRPVVIGFLLKKSRPLRGMERPVLAKSSGEEDELVYNDGPDDWVAADAAGAVAVVLVMSRTSTRRFLARPSLVLFESTGLSLPSPIK
jgi:hypothetical protein